MPETHHSKRVEADRIAWGSKFLLPIVELRFCRKATIFHPVEFQLSFGVRFAPLGQATGTIYSLNEPFTPRPWGAAVSVLYGNWE